MDYRNTLNLLNTSFPMRANLSKREPQWVKQWQKHNRYARLRAICKGRPLFILHDGPPYANGELHAGHAVNKVLKDLVIRSKTWMGFDAPYVPGWDCHGLPIEIMVEKQNGKHLPAKEFRQLCRQYAKTQVDRQSEGFKRMGVIGDWQHPYLTMDYMIEANIVRYLALLVKAGLIIKGQKPIHYCIQCASALAEAEIEYKDKQSDAIDVAFSLVDNHALTKRFKTTDIADIPVPIKAVIWTTTPWTLPANQAVSVHPDFNYVLIKTDAGYLLMEETLNEANLTKYQIKAQCIVARIKGKSLEGILLQHPFLSRQVPLLPGKHVTRDAGTGLVHTAPAHGLEDFQIGRMFDLPSETPVQKNGKFIDKTPLVGGLSIWASNPIIIEALKKNGCLLHHEQIVHSYPHCWRHKTPTIFLSTSQWFIAIDQARDNTPSLKEISIQATAQTEFFPAWAVNRLRSMLENRPDWCISRQRNWGVPLPFFIHQKSGELHPQTADYLEEIARRIEKQGVEAWFNLDKQEFLSAEEATQYNKSTDVLDVWFDSGTTHYSVLRQRLGLKPPVDIYLEGSDQHRGWFQSSLLTSCAVYGQAPFRQIFTHGFTVDEQGQKMSKSLGNVIAPEAIYHRYGADIMRLWIASTDTSNEIVLSDSILKQTADHYRRIRNTLRFLLSNLADFKLSEAIAIDQLIEIDQYALLITKHLQDKVSTQFYANYQFHHASYALIQFCSEDLGAFYLDILKDRLYTMPAASRGRKSAQTALYHLTCAFILMISPILCFTGEEAWQVLVNDTEDSPLFHTMHRFPALKETQDFTNKWQNIRTVRAKVVQTLENLRQAGHIGSSLQASVIITAPPTLATQLQSLDTELKFVLLVSQAQVIQGTSLQIEAKVSEGKKCERCWHYSVTVGKDPVHSQLCARCITNLNQGGENRRFV